MIAQRHGIVHGCFFVSRPSGGGFPWGLRGSVCVGPVSASPTLKRGTKRGGRLRTLRGSVRVGRISVCSTLKRGTKRGGPGDSSPGGTKGRTTAGCSGASSAWGGFPQNSWPKCGTKRGGRLRALRGSVRVGQVSASSTLKRGTKKRGSGGFFPRRYKELVSWRNLCYNSTRNAAVPSGRFRRFLL